MSIMTFTPTHVGSTGTAPALRAGEADEVGREIGREDDGSGHNGSGYERDETDTSFHRLVRQLMAGGDHRARSAGRHARRSLAEMAPGYVRQPVLVLHRPSMNDVCPLCTRWKCDPSNCPPGFAPAPTAAVSARTAVAR
ncbi:hypothetical protein OOK13_43480 [Streptomyces sp. NBC_00378]|uniref:hypothetical protein n=1 Tax=unclassified Streptomyces TaxID=2593676 RepID=UPI0022511313|nr:MULTISPECIES: hypothetical protein [unclassified Streptomyces]MCX5115192.1 hypothetical protein [Streptomyces sp. NBC_00378]